MVDIVPLASGLLSGFVGGVLAVYIRYRLERRAEVENWYQMTIRISERVERLQDEDYHPEEAVYARATAAGVLGELTELLMSPPQCVSDDLLEEMDELAFSLQVVSNFTRREAEASSGVIQLRVASA